MRRLLLYISVFIIGFSIAFLGGRIFNFSTNTKELFSPPPFVKDAEKNNTTLSPTDKEIELATDDIGEETTVGSGDVDSSAHSINSLEFIDGPGEYMDIMIDVTLPSLSKIASNSVALKKACHIRYPQYGNKNRYQWSKSYTLSQIQQKKSLNFYVQEDIWASFTHLQQKKLMSDLLYCDPLISHNKAIKMVQILSISDDTVLSRYKKES